MRERTKMSDFSPNAELESMAEVVFDLSNLSSALRSRVSAAASEFSETEYLAVDALAKDQPLTVGDIQKRIGVQPAQMSRILRSLENRPKSFVECRINAQDRRRVDVTLTAAGKSAHQDYRKARLGFATEVLANLPPEDRVQFMRILRSIHEEIVNRMNGGKEPRVE